MASTLHPPPAPPPTDVAGDASRPSDADDDDYDLRLFASCGDPHLLPLEVLQAKRNDPHLCRLTLFSDVHLDEAASRRLGDIVGRNDALEELAIFGGCHAAALCEGIGRNRGLRRLDIGGGAGLRLRDGDSVAAGLAPFLAGDPALREVTLWNCRIGPGDFGILTDALSRRPENTLEALHLLGNPLGDVALDGLLGALEGGTRLRSLNLSGCGVGRRTCASLATLLRRPASKLTRLHLKGNSLDDECATVLAASLADNRKLEVLDMKTNDGIGVRGWSAMLRLVCNASSVDGIANSNHVLGALYPEGTRDAAVRALGAEGGDLLHASLGINHLRRRRRSSKFDENAAIRRKVLRAHAAGAFDLGEFPVPEGLVPRVLAWLGDRDPDDIGAAAPPRRRASPPGRRLCGVYRVLRSNPGAVGRCGRGFGGGPRGDGARRRPSDPSIE